MRSNSSNRRGIVSPAGSKSIALLGRWRRNRKRGRVGGRISAISCAAAPFAARRAHLATADVQELVGDVERRLALEDPPADRVGAVARAAGRGEVLAAALDRGADQAPARGPVDVPDQLGAAAERRDAAAEAAALRPLDEIRAALVGDLLAVPVARGSRADPAAVLADDADRQPARRVVDRGHGAVDLEDHVGSVERAHHVPIHRAGGVVLGHPVEVGMDAQVGERLEEERREMTRVVGCGCPRAPARGPAARPCSARSRRARASPGSPWGRGPRRRSGTRPPCRARATARRTASCSTTPRRLPTWTVPDGVLESLTTCRPPTWPAISSAQ